FLEGGKGTHGAAELGRRAVGQSPFEVVGCFPHPLCPSGAHRAEGGGQGLLEQGASGHGGESVVGRQGGQGPAQCSQVGQYDPARAARQQHRRGVHDVLTGGTPVHVSCGLGVGTSYLCGQFLYQGDDGVSTVRCGSAQFLLVVVVRVAGSDDRLGLLLWQEPGVGQGPCQCRFGLQERTEPGGVVGERADGSSGEDPVEQAGHGPNSLPVLPGAVQMSKKTVSSSPWMRISKRYPSGAVRATRVSRASGSSMLLRTGSAALAFSSSGKYTRVTTRCSRPRANNDTSMCGAWGPFGPGTDPGLSVRMPKVPSTSVGQRPNPRKPGWDRAHLGSSGWSKRPSGSACQVSTRASPTGSPA